MNSAHRSPRDRLYQSFWQDGLLDLFLGLSLLGVGLGWLFDLVAISAVAPAMAVPLWQAARKKLTEPRLGYVKFDPPRRQQMQRGHLVLVALGIVSLLLGLFAFLAFDAPRGKTELYRTLVPGLPASIIAFGALLAGVLFQLPRLLTYGGVTFVLAFATIAWDFHPGWPLLFSGVTPLAVGLVLLVRFLHAFPVLPAELE